MDFHDTQDYRNSGVNVMVKSVMNHFSNDLIQSLKVELRLTEGELKSILIIK
jgi:hypothetical protein